MAFFVVLCRNFSKNLYFYISKPFYLYRWEPKNGNIEDYLIYKDKKNNQYFEKIIKELDPIINGSIKEIKGTKKEDLYQEIHTHKGSI